MYAYEISKVEIAIVYGDLGLLKHGKALRHF